MLWIMDTRFAYIRAPAPDLVSRRVYRFNQCVQRRRTDQTDVVLMARVLAAEVVVAMACVMALWLWPPTLWVTQ